MAALDDKEIAYNISILFKYLEDNYPYINDGLVPTLKKYRMARLILERHSHNSRYEIKVLLTCIITLSKNISKPHTRPSTFKDSLL